MNIQDYILYEDQHLIVCRKEAGIPVQTARMLQMDLESALKNYLMAYKTTESEQKNARAKKSNGQKNVFEKGFDNKNAGGKGQQPYLAVIHRLDQPVRGVLVFAKTPFAAKRLSAQVTNHTIGKYYLADVDGVIEKEEGTLEDFLLKDARTNTSKVVKEGTPNSKKAVLHYKKRDEHTVEIELVTGRHHQIRVQMAHAGMPLVHDTKYNPDAVPGRLGLCAYHLVFQHPKTGKKMEFYYKD